ncbi:hypothetical protein A2954_02490 [Candidatus Roizmanbacteria bacterium RIFCSPLOWO2_01_FULL_37_12]|uniref:PIN domain-containing protein n=1 Tax=Candidatus Roizmanbacteria bacterium RIFCSPLOWO2_01_FULL_37_12 TaxID=1802056 RepID=A0A1F7IEX7_9BACT|nr:MAG: hypothetical protein A3D76_00070 [Candidatus Roizmanbacteria bacterium RIFCSPHIGHO2_02_FULL_37_9b]OGK41894.1 MAG: hypothetical protein A2954_02490 [Candidatus Roizmanbacteria bacterium RIFCSPLOWO2_01_FULL_37_12]
MKKVILDSSVIIKWFKSEKEQKIKEATNYLDDFTNGKIQIYLTIITSLELLNSALYDLSLPQETWLLNIQKFYQLDIPALPIDDKIAHQIYSFGKKYNISAYDAAFVVLAKNYGCNFITADQKLVTKVNLPFVKPL